MVLASVRHVKELITTKRDECNFDSAWHTDTTLHPLSNLHALSSGGLAYDERSTFTLNGGRIVSVRRSLPSRFFAWFHFAIERPVQLQYESFMIQRHHLWCLEIDQN